MSEDVNYELPEPPEFAEDLKVIETGGAVPMGKGVVIHDDADDEVSERRGKECAASFAVRPFFWKDQQLAPFAIDREGDWNLHRELIGAPPISEIIGHPRAMLQDALRVLWFLSHEPETWLNVPSMVEVDGKWRHRSARDRAMFVEGQIREWAIANVPREDGALAVNTFYEIYNSSNSTRAVAKPSERHEEEREKKSPLPPPGLNT